ncbi:hypothetical protein BDP27DRAFT_1359454 [Rhodocollybia butyracea]|uniref:Uncharacterized protein n=1 Tax=Rhodocollybia butyracea TaxID=206335 RepID=A0A9P5Q2K4_9AGAR|nr:hypothetical protein BDP27DRAFT_1359454 [Rhodocollybia butyracea]
MQEQAGENASRPYAGAELSLLQGKLHIPLPVGLVTAVFRIWMVVRVTCYNELLRPKYVVNRLKALILINCEKKSLYVHVMYERRQGTQKLSGGWLTMGIYIELAEANAHNADRMMVLRDLTLFSPLPVDQLHHFRSSDRSEVIGARSRRVNLRSFLGLFSLHMGNHVGTTLERHYHKFTTQCGLLKINRTAAPAPIPKPMSTQLPFNLTRGRQKFLIREAKQESEELDNIAWGAAEAFLEMGDELFCWVLRTIAGYELHQFYHFVFKAAMLSGGRVVVAEIVYGSDSPPMPQDLSAVGLGGNIAAAAIWYRPREILRIMPCLRGGCLAPTWNWGIRGMKCILTSKRFEGQGSYGLWQSSSTGIVPPFLLESTSERSRARYLHLGFEIMEPWSNIGRGKVDSKRCTSRPGNKANSKKPSDKLEGITFSCMINLKGTVGLQKHTGERRTTKSKAKKRMRLLAVEDSSASQVVEYVTLVTLDLSNSLQYRYFFKDRILKKAFESASYLEKKRRTIVLRRFDSANQILLEVCLVLCGSKG